MIPSSSFNDKSKKPDSTQSKHIRSYSSIDLNKPFPAKQVYFNIPKTFGLIVDQKAKITAKFNINDIEIKEKPTAEEGYSEPTTNLSTPMYIRLKMQKPARQDLSQIKLNDWGKMQSDKGN